MIGRRLSSITDRLASGTLAVVEIAQAHPLPSFASHLDPNDPLEREFVAELGRSRQPGEAQASRRRPESLAAAVACELLLNRPVGEDGADQRTDRGESQRAEQGALAPAQA